GEAGTDVHGDRWPGHDIWDEPAIVAGSRRRLPRRLATCDIIARWLEWPLPLTPKAMPLRYITLALLIASAGAANARGASPYIVLGQSPEIERAIERVLILADDPVLTRPIPAARVLDALPAACEIDAPLCEQVRRYLAGLMKTAGIAHLSAAAAVTS